MLESEFYEALGYFSNRTIQIDAEVAEKSYLNFEKKYLNLTNINLSTSRIGDYYKIVDKWGVELRIYLQDISNIPKQLASLLRSDNYMGYTSRINNNDLIYKMFSHGFEIGLNHAAVKTVRTKVPQNYLQDFDNGSVL